MSISSVRTCFFVNDAEVISRLHCSQFFRRQTEDANLRLAESHRHQTRVFTHACTRRTVNEQLQWISQPPGTTRSEYTGYKQTRYKDLPLIRVEEGIEANGWQTVGAEIYFLPRFSQRINLFQFVNIPPEANTHIVLIHVNKVHALPCFYSKQ